MLSAYLAQKMKGWGQGGRTVMSTPQGGKDGTATMPTARENGKDLEGLPAFQGLF